MTLEGFDCTDCGQNTFSKREYYMLHDEVWLSAASKYEMLCVACFEERLGRQLNHDDFVKLPINFGCVFPQSDLLCSRLYEKGHIYG
jgi:hypothetical protein